MALKVELQKRNADVVGKGVIDGSIPFYFKDQGHRWMVRIGQDWSLKQKEVVDEPTPSLLSSRHKIYWAISQFRNQSKDSIHVSA